jgi:hypothetical protein
MFLFATTGGVIFSAIIALFVMWVISLITQQSVQDVFLTSVGCAVIIFVIAAAFMLISTII